MRDITTRGELSASTRRRMIKESTAIAMAADPAAEAATRYASARRAKWFKPITATLAAMSGRGERCMYCSGSEAAQVEHHRPKSRYPSLALQWENLLWVCGICNQSKGQRFDDVVPPLNPVDDSIWEHLFIDQFGNLRARWSTTLNGLDPRAVATIGCLSLDRQALQEARHSRLKDLRQKVRDAVTFYSQGQLSQDDLVTRLMEWFDQPFQPDVVDYFLRGPGQTDASEPFRDFLAAAGL